MWKVAKDSGVLDANSSYAYLLWCRDFRETSIVAEVAGEISGFITGYLRPAAPDTLFIWQVAVDESQRGKGIGVAMLDQLLSDLPAVSWLETTVSPDNAASIAMFEALARRRETSLAKQKLFGPSHFPDSHEAEDLYLLGPLSTQ
jgi:L-2,4-diaminobutyric acid acetyltransferase